jgi:dipeptidyl aminopeptidase/acylaminoacyl peptidase
VRSFKKLAPNRVVPCDRLAPCAVVCLISCLWLSGCNPTPPPVQKGPAAKEDATAKGQPAGGQEQTQSTPLGAAVALIPRKVLFGNPDKAAARLSPDGSKLSFLAPVDGVLNVWVGPVDDPAAARPVTQDKKRGIRVYFWAYTGNHVIYMQDTDGDENYHVYVVDLEKDETRDVTPLKGVRAEIEAVSYKFPEEILIGLNDRDPEFHDVYRLKLKSGERTLVQENKEFAGFVTDDDYRIRFAERVTPDGGQELLEPAGEGQWKSFAKIGMEDAMTTSPAGFDKTGKILYLVDSRGRNTAALTTVDLETGTQTLVAEDPRADLSGLMVHPTENTIQGVAFDYLRRHWELLDPAVAEDFKVLGGVAEGDIEVASRTLDDRHWIVAFLQDDGPLRYYHYDRDTKQARFLFTNRKELEGLPLVKMHPVVIKSRDGLDLVSYLSLPAGTDPDGDGRPDKPLPMVLDVHGGPWARVDWGYSPSDQWFANRGYAVLSVNYRGSTGFGKEFLNAGNKEWAGKAHDDLVDAVHWAEKEGIADPQRVAIFGGSYGGYATLVGLTFTPKLFACGVDIVGPSSLVTLLNSVPPYWKPMIEMFKTRVGDYTTEEGRAFLLKRSPLTHVDKIQRPLLIGQGANDPRVKQAEADQIVKAMQEKKIPVTYVLYSDEGHGFARPENRLSFFAVAEAFLAKCLGGRFQPVGDDFQGSTIAVPTGADYIPGLPEALKNKPAPTAP